MKQGSESLVKKTQWCCNPQNISERYSGPPGYFLELSTKDYLSSFPGRIISLLCQAHLVTASWSRSLSITERHMCWKSWILWWMVIYDLISQYVDWVFLGVKYFNFTYVITVLH